jgi:acetyltransferase-like isoleucine patch superfamily enzyme
MKIIFCWKNKFRSLHLRRFNILNLKLIIQIKKKTMTDIEKMAAGEVYWGFHPDFVPPLERGKDFCFLYNQTPPSDKDSKRRLLEEFLQKVGRNVLPNSPIHIDFGNMEIGEDTVINFNLVVLDEALVKIGNHCFIGPNCSIYTVVHSLDYEERNQGFMYAKPVVISDNCWLGGSVTVLPGVTIGEGSVIGAGSVVTKDIPAGVLAYGNPCKVIKKISQK